MLIESLNPDGQNELSEIYLHISDTNDDTSILNTAISRISKAVHYEGSGRYETSSIIGLAQFSE